MAAYGMVPLAVLLAVGCCEAGLAELVLQLAGWPTIDGRHCATLNSGEAQWLAGTYVGTTATSVLLCLLSLRPAVPRIVVAGASIPALLIFLVVFDLTPQSIQ